MPVRNYFRHQTYFGGPPAASYEFLCPQVVDSWERVRVRLRHVGDALRRAGVVRVYLIHGTFAGVDAFGLFREVGRVLPDLAALLLAFNLITMLRNEFGDAPANARHLTTLEKRSRE